MLKRMYKIEINGDGLPPEYIYIEADGDIEIDHYSSEVGKITHITTIDDDLGIEPDLVVKRRV